MSFKDQLETDVYAFFKNIASQTPEDQRKTLRQLIEKYAHLSSAECILNKDDFRSVKEHAHNFYMASAFPEKISGNRDVIEPHEANILSIIEGTIHLLNTKDCFKKTPKFDYRD